VGTIEAAAGPNGVGLQFQNGEWRCTNCGAAVPEVSASTVPVTLTVEREDQPRLRIIEVDRVEVHRCEIREKPRRE
jgi:hypothetical protein